MNMEKDLAFLDISVYVSRENRITRNWYQKQTSTGIKTEFSLLCTVSA